MPCFYQVARMKDISDMCWGRGPCPNSKCSNKILHTTGNRVTFRKSPRYNLQGYISYGDVSLTIWEVKVEDAGTYCCRIEIPGWFNDIKQNINLVVARGEFWGLLQVFGLCHTRFWSFSFCERVREWVLETCRKKEKKKQTHKSGNWELFWLRLVFSSLDNHFK